MSEEKTGINFYLTLAKEFSFHNSSLYLVGGTVRDILLKQNLEISNFDLATPSLPEEGIKILSNKGYQVRTPFQRYGVIQVKHQKIHYDIVTLRKEKRYRDSRHPLEIMYVTSLKQDVKRRDFTINGLYMNDHFELFDYVGGKKDLDEKVIRMIGRPKKRLKEDPLRIVRALRFALDLNFTLEKKLEKTMQKQKKFLQKLNPKKIEEEIKKIKCVDIDKKEALLSKYGVIRKEEEEKK